MTSRPAHTATKPTLQVRSLGVLPYEDAWRLQRDVAQRRSAGTLPDTLLLLQHPPTYTCGRSTRPEHLLCPPETLAAQGIAFYDVDRGGDITYHGPGQLVGYPILKLSRYTCDLVAYLRLLEDVLIRALARFGLHAQRIAGLTGVWIEGRKVAAIGVKLSAGGVTMHGFALNVAPDLRPFQQIIPCGIRGRGVTSLAQELDSIPQFRHVEQEVCMAFGDVLGCAIECSLGDEALDD